MFREIASQASGLLPSLSTLLCFTLFALVGIYVLTDRRRGHHRAMERMPLDDGSNDHA